MPKAKTIEYSVVKDALAAQGLMETTALSYISKMRKVLSGAIDNTLPSITRLRRSHKDIIKYCQSDALKNPNLKKVYLMSICHLFQIYDISISPFEKYVCEWSALADANAVNGTTEAEMEKIESIDFDEIRSSIADTKDPDDRLIKAFYTLLPPLRQQDVVNLVVYTQKKDPKRNDINYIHLPTKQMVINEHKTKRIHGTKYIDIPKQLADEIKRYLDETHRVVLLPMTSSGFSKRMSKMFGVSSSIFRKAYISRYTPDMTPDQLYRTSQIMGHRINTQLISYRKALKEKEQLEVVPELEHEDPVELSSPEATD